VSRKQVAVQIGSGTDRLARQGSDLQHAAAELRLYACDMQAIEVSVTAEGLFQFGGVGKGSHAADLTLKSRMERKQIFRSSENPV
jgi:hypothetical protein